MDIDRGAGYCFVYLQTNFKTSSQTVNVKLNILSSFIEKDLSDLKIQMIDIFLAFLAFRIPVAELNLLLNEDQQDDIRDNIDLGRPDEHSSEKENKFWDALLFNSFTKRQEGMILSPKKEQDVIEYCRSISKFLRNDDLSRNFEKFLLRRKLKQNTETHKSDIFDVGITITNRKNQEKKTFLGMGFNQPRFTPPTH